MPGGGGFELRLQRDLVATERADALERHVARGGDHAPEVVAAFGVHAPSDLAAEDDQKREHHAEDGVAGDCNLLLLLVDKLPR